MTSLTPKNIPDNLSQEDLGRVAERGRRSVTQQVACLFKQARGQGSCSAGGRQQGGSRDPEQPPAGPTEERT